MNQRNTQLAPNSMLGAFEILEFIAQGGMGSVYKARNRISGEVRAIKIILPELASDQTFVSRFIREIKIASAVEHPNLVRVFEPAMHGDMMFLPMEMLQGETLSARIRRQRRLDVQETLAILVPTASAVAAVHARGIIHRDLKPANIFLAADSAGVMTPKVLDFGAARTSDIQDDNTMTGVVIGSPPYMSYEQAAGLKDIDARADQYALAVIAYQLLSGTRPYENDDTGLALAKVLQGAPFPRLSDLNPAVPLALEAAILRAMSRDRNNRFRDVDEFVAAMKPSLEPGTVISAISTVQQGADVTLPFQSGGYASLTRALHSAPIVSPVEGHSSSTIAKSSLQVTAARSTTNYHPLLLLLIGALILATLAVGVGGAWRASRSASASRSETHEASPLPAILPSAQTVALPDRASTALPSPASVSTEIVAAPKPVVSAVRVPVIAPAHPVLASTPSHASTAAALCVPRPGVPCL